MNLTSKFRVNSPTQTKTWFSVPNEESPAHEPIDHWRCCVQGLRKIQQVRNWGTKIELTGCSTRKYVKDISMLGRLLCISKWSVVIKYLENMRGNLIEARIILSF